MWLGQKCLVIMIVCGIHDGLPDIENGCVCVYIFSLMFKRSFIILIRSYRVLRGPRLLAGPAEADWSLSLSPSLHIYYIIFISLSLIITYYNIMSIQVYFSVSLGSRYQVLWAVTVRGLEWCCRKKYISTWEKKIITSKSPETYFVINQKRTR